MTRWMQASISCTALMLCTTTGDTTRYAVLNFDGVYVACLQVDELNQAGSKSWQLRLISLAWPRGSRTGPIQCSPRGFGGSLHFQQLRAEHQRDSDTSSIYPADANPHWRVSLITVTPTPRTFLEPRAAGSLLSLLRVPEFL